MVAVAMLPVALAWLFGGITFSARDDDAKESLDLDEVETPVITQEYLKSLHGPNESNDYFKSVQQYNCQAQYIRTENDGTTWIVDENCSNSIEVKDIDAWCKAMELEHEHCPGLVRHFRKAHDIVLFPSQRAAGLRFQNADGSFSKLEDKSTMALIQEHGSDFVLHSKDDFVKKYIDCQHELRGPCAPPPVENPMSLKMYFHSLTASNDYFKAQHEYMCDGQYLSTGGDGNVGTLKEGTCTVDQPVQAIFWCKDSAQPDKQCPGSFKYYDMRQYVVFTPLRFADGLVTYGREHVLKADGSMVVVRSSNLLDDPIFLSRHEYEEKFISCKEARASSACTTPAAQAEMFTQAYLNSLTASNELFEVERVHHCIGMLFADDIVNDTTTLVDHFCTRQQQIPKVSKFYCKDENSRFSSCPGTSKYYRSSPNTVLTPKAAAEGMGFVDSRDKRVHTLRSDGSMVLINGADTPFMVFAYTDYEMRYVQCKEARMQSTCPILATAFSQEYLKSINGSNENFELSKDLNCEGAYLYKFNNEMKFVSEACEPVPWSKVVPEEWCKDEGDEHKNCPGKFKHYHKVAKTVLIPRNGAKGTYFKDPKDGKIHLLKADDSVVLIRGERTGEDFMLSTFGEYLRKYIRCKDAIQGTGVSSCLGGDIEQETQEKDGSTSASLLASMLLVITGCLWKWW